MATLAISLRAGSGDEIDQDAVQTRAAFIHGQM